MGRRCIRLVGTRLFPLLRPPITRQFLRFGKLGRCHFCGDRVSASYGQVMALAGRQAGGGYTEPHVGAHVVQRDTSTGGEHEAEGGLGFGGALLCREPIPLERLRMVLWDAIVTLSI